MGAVPSEMLISSLLNTQLLALGGERVSLFFQSLKPMSQRTWNQTSLRLPRLYGNAALHVFKPETVLTFLLLLLHPPFFCLSVAAGWCRPMISGIYKLILWGSCEICYQYLYQKRERFVQNMFVETIKYIHRLPYTENFLSTLSHICVYIWTHTHIHIPAL